MRFQHKSLTETAAVISESELLQYQPHCRACGKRVGVDDAFCPHCGTWEHARSEPEPADYWGYVGAIVMALTAVAVTLPTLVGLTDVVRGHKYSDAMILAAWHCFVWGVPIAVVLYRWRRNLLTQRPAMERIAKTYVIAQFLALFLLPWLILTALLMLKDVLPE